MNESQLARDFMKDLRKLLPKNAVIFRHVTLYASGIPDYSVTCNGKTLWLEFKSWVGDRKPEFQMLQAKNLKKLDGWYVIFVDDETVLLTQNPLQDFALCVSDIPIEKAQRFLAGLLLP